MQRLRGAVPAPAAVLRPYAVGFTPVKGTRHLLQPDAVFDAAGPVGDRGYCLIDVRRRRVLKTVQNPSLIAVLARRDGRLLDVTLPDGRRARAVPGTTGEVVTCAYWGRPVRLSLADGPHAALFSSWLGRPVRLAVAPRGAVVYGAPVTVVATASVTDLGERAAHPGLLGEAGRFRATFVVHTDVPYIEDSWAGATIRIGPYLMQAMSPIPRCAVIDHDPVTGARRGTLLKTLAGYRRTNDAGEPHFGLYARLVPEAEPSGRPPSVHDG